MQRYHSVLQSCRRSRASHSFCSSNTSVRWNKEEECTAACSSLTATEGDKWCQTLLPLFAKMHMSFKIKTALQLWHLRKTQDTLSCIQLFGTSEPLCIYTCILICRYMITCICACVHVCKDSINHWSWAGGWCCSLHLSLSAGVRYFTLMMGQVGEVRKSEPCSSLEGKAEN